MPRYRLLAIDVDGTLVNSSDELTPATQAACSATAAGIHVVLATGRRYSHTLHLVEPLGISVPLVTAGGALIKDPATHQTLYKTEIDRGLLCEFLATLNRVGWDALLNGDTFTEGFDFYQPPKPRPNRYLAEYLRAESRLRTGLAQFLCFSAAADFRRLRDGHARGNVGRGNGGACGPAGQDHNARAPKSALPRLYVRTGPGRGDEMVGIRRLAAGWGIADEEICAVGDDVNDIPMIRAAGLGVAMGNAVPEVIAAANRVAPTHDHDGLVEVVGWLLN